MIKICKQNSADPLDLYKLYVICSILQNRPILRILNKNHKRYIRPTEHVTSDVIRWQHRRSDRQRYL